MAFNKTTVLTLALALILFSALGLSEGRICKLEKNNVPSMSSTTKYEVMGNEGDNDPNLSQPRIVYPPAPAPSVEAFRLINPAHSPGVGHLEYPEDGHPVDPPSYGQVAAFRPTSPGHSPGVGHLEYPEDGHPVDPPSYGQVAAFRPTSPGHSPGAGHKVPPPAPKNPNM